MADYKKMYFELFNEVSKAIDILQNAQKNSEKLFIESSNKPPILFEAPPQKKIQ